MERDEWLIYRNMGAYNNSLETDFNGFEEPKLFYIE
jgi:diaminopimelate decarboxylase